MKLSSLKTFLTNTDLISIELPNGEFVPSHFHITEIGLITKHFIDCGGTVREEKNATMQVWTANDIDHRLAPHKLLGIISTYENIIGNEDLDLEIEYQSDTIGKYGIEIHEHHLILVNKETNCLAKDHCGIPTDKLKVNLSELETVSSSTSCCTPGGGCC